MRENLCFTKQVNAERDADMFILHAMAEMHKFGYSAELTFGFPRNVCSDIERLNRFRRPGRAVKFGDYMWTALARKTDTVQAHNTIDGLP